MNDLHHFRFHYGLMLDKFLMYSKLFLLKTHLFVDITIRNCLFLATSDKSIACLKKQAYTVISVGPKKLMLGVCMYMVFYQSALKSLIIKLMIQFCKNSLMVAVWLKGTIITCLYCVVWMWCEKQIRAGVDVFNIRVGTFILRLTQPLTF